METNKSAFVSPKELQSNTSVLTLLAYVLYGLTLYLSLPYFLWYIIVLLLGINLFLIGLLFYRIEQEKHTADLAKSRFKAGFRLLINLVIMFIVLFHMGLI